MGMKPLLKLNERHEAYCLGRVAGRPKVDAYMEAGFKASRSTARREASKLEQEPVIAARLRTLYAEKFKQLHMTADEVLYRLALVARADARTGFDDEGKPLPPHKLTDEAAAAITGWDADGRPRLRDTTPVLRILAEHHKVIKAPEEGLNALAGAIADRLKAARERKRKESP